MAEVKRYYKYKGHIIRHVLKTGRWCFDVTFSLLLFDTLKEAKQAVDEHIKRGKDK